MFCSLLFAKLDKMWSAWRVNMRVSKLRNLDPGTSDSSRLAFQNVKNTKRALKRMDDESISTFRIVFLSCFTNACELIMLMFMYVAIFNSVFTSISERRGPSIPGPSTGRSLWRADPQRFATCEGHPETFETFWKTCHRVANLWIQSALWILNFSGLPVAVVV